MNLRHISTLDTSTPRSFVYSIRKLRREAAQACIPRPEVTLSPIEYERAFEMADRLSKAYGARMSRSSQGTSALTFFLFAGVRVSCTQGGSA